MEKAQRDQLILIVLSLAVILYVWAYGFGFVGIKPLGVARAEVAKLQEQRKALEESIKNAQDQVAGLEKIKKEREVLEAQLAELTRRLPSERETPEILRKVETLAGKSGLRIAQVKRRPVRAQDLYVEIPMEVGVGGNYPELLKFADELAQLDRLVTLTEAQVVRRAPGALGLPAAADADPGAVKAQVVAVVFQTLPEPEPDKAGAGAKK